MDRPSSASLPVRSDRPLNPRGAASSQGRADLLGMWAGMGVGELRSEKTAATVLDEIEAEAWGTFERLRPTS